VCEWCVSGCVFVCVCAVTAEVRPQTELRERLCKRGGEGEGNGVLVCFCVCVYVCVCEGAYLYVLVKLCMGVRVYTLRVYMCCMRIYLRLCMCVRTLCVLRSGIPPGFSW
jgi:hypothetical protein